MDFIQIKQWNLKFRGEYILWNLDLRLMLYTLPLAKYVDITLYFSFLFLAKCVHHISCHIWSLCFLVVVIIFIIFLVAFLLIFVPSLYLSSLHHPLLPIETWSSPLIKTIYLLLSLIKIIGDEGYSKFHFQSLFF